MRTYPVKKSYTRPHPYPTKRDKFRCLETLSANQRTFRGITVPLLQLFPDEFCQKSSTTVVILPAPDNMADKFIRPPTDEFVTACYMMTAFLFSGDARSLFAMIQLRVEAMGNEELVQQVTDLIQQVKGEDEETANAVLKLSYLINCRHSASKMLQCRLCSPRYTTAVVNQTSQLLQQVKQLKTEIEKETQHAVGLVTGDTYYTPLHNTRLNGVEHVVMGLITPTTLWVLDGHLFSETLGVACLRFQGAFLKDIDPVKYRTLQKVSELGVIDKRHVSVDIPDLKPETKAAINEYLYGPVLSTSQRKQLVDTLNILLEARKYRRQDDPFTVTSVLDDLCPHRHRRYERGVNNSHIYKIKEDLRECFNGRWPTANTSRNLHKGIQLLNQLYRCMASPNDIWLSKIMLRREVVEDIVKAVL